MSEYDSKNTTKGEVALNNQDITTNTTTLGNSIDTLDFDSITFHVQSGGSITGNFVFELNEADPLPNMPTMPGVFSAVSGDNIIGPLTGFIAGEINVTKRVGSIGKKRFQRISIASNTVSGSNLFSALAILGHAKDNPTAD